MEKSITVHKHAPDSRHDRVRFRKIKPFTTASPNRVRPITMLMYIGCIKPQRKKYSARVAAIFG
jgi:hypothetical protein